MAQVCMDKNLILGAGCTQYMTILNWAVIMVLWKFSRLDTFLKIIALKSFWSLKSCFARSKQRLIFKATFLGILPLFLIDSDRIFWEIFWKIFWYIFWMSFWTDYLTYFLNRFFEGFFERSCTDFWQIFDRFLTDFWQIFWTDYLRFFDIFFEWFFGLRDHSLKRIFRLIFVLFGPFIPLPMHTYDVWHI